MSKITGKGSGKMELSTLDEYCQKILGVLLLMRQDYRFNELYRFLNKNGIKISKPTLSEHLKHLMRHNLLLRQEEGIQKVIYKVNYDRFKKLAGATDISQDVVTRFFLQREHFKSLPIDRKIECYHGIMVLQSLLLLKLELLSISQPENQFEYSITTQSTIQHFGTIRDWIIETIRDNPEVVKQATEELRNLIDQLEKEFFLVLPKP